MIRVATAVVGMFLASAAGCAWPAAAPGVRPEARIAVEPVVGALGELRDAAEVGWGVSATYLHPVGRVLDSDLLVEARLGMTRNDVSSEFSVPTGNPNIPPPILGLEDTATGVHGELGGRLRFGDAGAGITPYAAAGVTYWDFTSDIGDADGPGGYVGLGVEWSISANATFGIDGSVHFLQLDGGVEGLGVVPVLGLSFGYRF